MKLELNACWSNENEVKELKAQWKCAYNVDASFHDGGDYYSTWTLIGSKENVEKCALENWGDDYEENVI